MRGERDLAALLGGRADGGERPALGIMGGTFDPVHIGHVELARAARTELSLGAVLFVPAGNPSFKQGRDLAPAPLRLEMLRRALEGEGSWAGLSDRELRRPGVTYTVDTLRELAGVFSERVRLVFLMGADSLESLPLWHEAHAVLDLCEVAVAAREGVALKEALARLRAFHPTARLHVLSSSVPAVSSTSLRARLGRGELPRELPWPGVVSLIQEKGLYGYTNGS